VSALLGKKIKGGEPGVPEEDYKVGEEVAGASNCQCGQKTQLGRPLTIGVERVPSFLTHKLVEGKSSETERVPLPTLSRKKSFGGRREIPSWDGFGKNGSELSSLDGYFYNRGKEKARHPIKKKGRQGI